MVRLRPPLPLLPLHGGGERVEGGGTPPAEPRPPDPPSPTAVAAAGAVDAAAAPTATAPTVVDATNAVDAADADVTPAAPAAVGRQAAVPRRPPPSPVRWGAASRDRLGPPLSSPLLSVDALAAAAAASSGSGGGGGGWVARRLAGCLSSLTPRLGGQEVGEGRAVSHLWRPPPPSGRIAWGKGSRWHGGGEPPERVEGGGRSLPAELARALAAATAAATAAASVAAAAAAAAAGRGDHRGGAADGSRAGGRPGTVAVRFSWDGGGGSDGGGGCASRLLRPRQVLLLASFAGWEAAPVALSPPPPPLPMGASSFVVSGGGGGGGGCGRGGDGGWSVIVRLPPGRHAYVYMLDGALAVDTTRQTAVVAGRGVVNVVTVETADVEGRGEWELGE
ncbi:hypothetical protein MMPV_003573 [Pyropia vietnamensis]